MAPHLLQMPSLKILHLQHNEITKLPTLPAEPIVFCGNVLSRDELPNEHLGAWQISSVQPYLASAIAEMTETSNGEPLVPLYIRKTDAEIKRREGSSS